MPGKQAAEIQDDERFAGPESVHLSSGIGHSKRQDQRLDDPSQETLVNLGIDDHDRADIESEFVETLADTLVRDIARPE